MLNPAETLATVAGERKVIEADEIRVGPIVITKTSDGGAGIWFNGAPMIAIFDVHGKYAQTGIGIYHDGKQHACNVCLLTDHKDGGGAIQFCRGKEVVYLTFDDVKKIVDARGG